jgi:CDP-glycerol glycerophosphotransferase
MPSYVHNASSFPDMQELLIVSDAGVTDYSSWILDYLITRKPGFLFGSNIGEYEISRGFYHDFADTPFELATTNDELLANIASFDQLAYETRIEKFFDACQLMDDGLASSRIADFVLELAATPISRT